MAKMTFLSLLFFAFACGDKPSTSSGATGDTINSPNTKPSFTVDVKDKQKPVGLQAAVPAAFKSAGWIKTLNSAAVPAKKPATNTAYFTATKTIDGRKRTISVIFGNLLAEPDAVVNAANSGLEGGGGIDGAIHKAALVGGKDLMKEEAIAYKKMHNISSFPVGSAMATHAYGLGPKIKMVIFTVGPQGASDAQKDRELYSAFYNSLAKASDFGAKIISLPLVSTGIFGFPEDKGAELFFKAALQFLDDQPSSSIETINVVDFGSAKINVLKGKFQLAFP